MNRSSSTIVFALIALLWAGVAPVAEAALGLASTPAVSWSGAGDGTSWTDSRNWNGGQVPKAGTDVVISGFASSTISLGGLVANIRSLQCDAGLNVTSGGIMLNGGASRIMGRLVLALGSSLTVRGSGTSLLISSDAAIGGGNLYTQNGATLDLPNIKSLESAGGVWQALGTGSRISLSALVDARLGTNSWQYLQAQNGGRIELGALVELEDGYVNVLADGASSVVDLSSLERYLSGTRSGRMEASNGGTILVPKLVQIPKLDLSWGPLGNLALPGITQMSGGSLTVSGVTIVLPGLEKIDGVNLSASNGGVLELPAIKTCQSNSGMWQATGTGSRLVLAGLTTAILGGNSWHNLRAQNGGLIDLSALVELGEGYVNVFVDGVNSLIDLGTLQRYVAVSHSGIIEVRNGGTILLPNLAQIPKLDLTWGARANLSLPLVKELLGGSLTAAGTSVVLPALEKIEGVSLSASNGGVLDLPAITSCPKASGTWQATGAGSRISVKALASAVGGTLSTLTIRAQDGGLIDLKALVELGEGTVSCFADGAGSVVDLGALERYSAVTHAGTFDVRNGGAILVPKLSQVPKLNLRWSSQGKLELPLVRALKGGSLSADKMSVVLAALESLEDVSLSATDGGTLDLPAVTSCRTAGGSWQANGAGSRIRLGALVQAILGDGGWHYLQALNGGRLELGALAELGDGYINVLADGSNSVVDLSGLVRYVAATRSGAFEARNGGTILVPKLSQIPKLDLSWGTQGTLALPRITQLTGGMISAAGTTVLLPGLEMIDNVNLSASGGGTLELPAVKSCQTRSGSWQATGAGSRITLSGLTSAVLGTSSLHYMQSLNGGTIELRALVELGEGYTTVLADGVNSIVDLTALERYVAATRSGGLEARNGGTILVPKLSQVAKLDLTWGVQGMLSLPLVRELTGGTLTANGTTVVLPGFEKIDNVNLRATAGGVLELPSVATYRSTFATWQANGAGSRITLSSLTSALTGSTSYHYLQALAGARVELGALRDVGDGYLSVLADGANSVVDLSHLETYLGVTRSGIMEARAGGTILVSGLRESRALSLTIRQTGRIVLLSLRTARNGTFTIDGTAASLPTLADTQGTKFVFQNGGSASFLPLTFSLKQVPQSQGKRVGETATFTVAAEGQGPFLYQWRKNGFEIGGATTASLTRSPLTAEDAGDYSAQVSNGIDTLLSPPARLEILTGPSVVSGPRPTTVVASIGQTLHLQIVAAGSEPLSYQWLKNGSPVPGATGPSLNLPNPTAADAGTYSVRVSNSLATITSPTALVQVLELPRILAEPASVTVPLGAQAQFQVQAVGSAPLRYQWRHNGQNIPDATQSILVINPVELSDAGAYTVVVANEAGVTISEPAQLMLNLPTVVAGDHFAQRVALPSDAVGVIATSTLQATRESGEPRHAGKLGQHSVWFSWTAPTAGPVTMTTVGSDFDTLLGIYTGAQLGALTEIVSDDDHGGFFTSEATFNAAAGTTYLVAVDGLGDEAGQLILSWQLEPAKPAAPIITTSPASVTALPGAQVRLKVTAQNAQSYQWFVRGTPVAGANGPELTLSSLSVADVGTYVVAVSGGGTTVLSQPAVVEIGEQPGVRSYDKLEELVGTLGGGLQVAEVFDRSGLQSTEPSPPRDSAAVGLAELLSPGGSVPPLVVSAGVPRIQLIDNSTATTQQREDNHCGVIGYHSRWLAVRPDSAGVLVVRCPDNRFPVVLALYSSGRLGDAALSCAVTEPLRYSGVTVGKTYFLAVDGVDGATGPMTIECRVGQEPPLSTAPPARQELEIGGSALLQAPAGGTGAPPSTYQWLRDGEPVPLASAPQLALQLSSALDGGLYSVIMDNGIGRVTNAVARVIVKVPLSVQGPAPGDGARVDLDEFVFVLRGKSGQSVQVEQATDWADWKQRATTWLSPAGRAEFRDPRSAAGKLVVYRAIEVPLHLESDRGVFAAGKGQQAFRVVGGQLGQHYLLEQSANGGSSWAPLRTNTVETVDWHFEIPGDSTLTLRVRAAAD